MKRLFYAVGLVFSLYCEEAPATSPGDILEVLTELKKHIVLDDSLTPDECQALLEHLAELEAEENLTRGPKVFHDKIYRSLAVKYQLIANNLVVPTDTILNNVSIEGSFDVCNGISACDLIKRSQLLTGTSEDIPHTLVLRDETGSFAATTVTVTGGIVLQAANASSVTLLPNPATESYMIQLPGTTGTNGYVLTSNGAGQTSWQQIEASGSLIELNNLTTQTQFFANGYASSEPQFNSAINTHTLNIPLASTYGVLAGLVTSTNYYNFINSYTTLVVEITNGVTYITTITGDVGSVSGPVIALTGHTTAGSSVTFQGSGSALTLNVTDQLFNTMIGQNAGSALLTGTNNTAFGYNAGASLTTGYVNTFVGAGAGASNTTGKANTFVGYNAGFNNQMGNNNTFAGSRAGFSNVVGNNNTAVGDMAGYSMMGSNNSLVGQMAGMLITTGSNNSIVGQAAANQLTTGSNNLILGQAAGQTYTSNESGNIIIGQGVNGRTGENNTTRVGNSYIADPVSDTIFVGLNAGNSTYLVGTAVNNSALGVATLSSLTVGTNNTALGAHALTNLTSGNNNSAVGVGALLNVTNLSNTIGIGQLTQVTAADGIALGRQAQAGAQSISIGSLATALNASGVSIGYASQAFTQATTLGYQTTATTGGLAIGYQAAATGTSSVAVGNQALASGQQSVVLNGSNNSASGTASFAAGTNAAATANGSFVWADGSGTGLTSSTANSFNIYASNGVFMPGSISGFTVSGPAVLVSASTGQLGVASSSRRYKENIEFMPAGYSARVLELEPVTFNYRTTPDVESFGLIAEEVHELFPQLVVYNAQGQPETIKYHELPVLLLNELKKDYIRTKNIEDKLALLIGPHTRSPRTDKIYRSLAVKNQLIANSLVVVDNAALNNVTVDGSFNLCSVPVCDLVDSFTFLLTATSNNIPLTLVLRDNTGSFVATTITVTSGTLELQAPNGDSLTLLPNPITNSYMLQLPTTGGTDGSVLTADGSGITSWQPITTEGHITELNNLTASEQYFANGFAGIQPAFNSAINTHTLNIPLASSYGVLAGLITSTDYYNFQNTYTTVSSVVFTATITGDVGSISGSGVSLKAQTAAGASVAFQGSGSSMTLHVTDANLNTFMGRGAGNTTLSGTNNSALGFKAGQSLTTGFQNTIAGSLAGALLTTGTNNTFIGESAGQNSATGCGNTLLGISAGGTGTLTGSGNTCAGLEAGQALTSGSNNIFFCKTGGLINTVGSNNSVFSGTGLASAATGSNNALFNASGSSGGYTGSESNNIGVGNGNVRAGESNTIRIGGLIADTLNRNIFVGPSSSNLTYLYTATNNATLGAATLAVLTTGTNNTALGAFALSHLTTGSGNIALGVNALSTLTNVSNALGIGLLSQVTAADGIALGRQAQAGSRSIGIGSLSTVLSSSAVAIGYGSQAFTQATTLGYQTTATTSSIALGYMATATGISSVALGYQAYAGGAQAVVLNGSGNRALGTASLAAGTNASAATNGTFVWADGSGTGLISTTTNSFNIYASGGVFMPNSITPFTVTGAAVLVNAVTGQLGTMSSSRRYKENIKPMSEDYSAKVLELEPVTFNYRVAPTSESFGLIAEDVHELFPQLVVYNAQGQPETVKYHELPILLLNELKKSVALTDFLEELLAGDATRAPIFKDKIYRSLGVKDQLIAENLTVTNNAVFNNLVIEGSGTACGVTICDLLTGYSLILTATSADVPNTLVLRDDTGSFAATTLTVTGGIALQAGSGSVVTLLPNVTTNAYPLQLPADAGTFNYVLATDGTGVTSWRPVGIDVLNGLSTPIQFFANGYAGVQPAFNSAINTHTLNIPLASSYGVLAGLITSTDYYNFQNTYTTLSASSAIQRIYGDSGSAAGRIISLTANATAGYTVTFTGSGTSMTLNVTTTNLSNTFIGLTPGSSAVTGANSVALGYDTGITSLTTGADNLFIGSQAGFHILGTLAGEVFVGHQAGGNGTINADCVAIGQGSAGLINGSYTTVAGQGSGIIGIGGTGLGGNANIIGQGCMPALLSLSSYIIGQGSGVNMTTATHSVVLGQGAANAYTVETGNSIVGQGVNGVAGETNITRVGNNFIADANNNNILVGPATGSQTLLLTVANNSSLGAGTLSSLTTGTNNTALGAFALSNLTSGTNNIALGVNALSNVTNLSNTIGIGQLTQVTAADGIALGRQAQAGAQSISIGSLATASSASGVGIGYASQAFTQATTLGYQTTATTGGLALGYQAAATGTSSVAIGNQALASGQQSVVLNGSNNSASGTASFAAGTNAAATANGSFVWADGSGVGLTSTVANSFNVYASGGVFTVSGGTVTGAAMLVDSTTGQLGTVSSSRRYKENIKPMVDEYSAKILELEPVTFNYIQPSREATAGQAPKVESFGLIAEDVHELFPQLVVYNAQGQPETIKYHELPVLLLNELKKLSHTKAYLYEQIMNYGK